MLSFFQKLEAAVKSMWKKAPAIEVALASAVNQLVPVVEALDTIADPELAVVINPILDKIKVGLTALKVTIQGAGSSPNVATILGSVSANLDALLGVAEVKDPATKQKIADVVAIVKAEVATIGAALPAAAVV